MFPAYYQGNDQNSYPGNSVVLIRAICWPSIDPFVGLIARNNYFVAVKANGVSCRPLFDPGPLP